MSAKRIYLGLSVLVWLPYGIYCLLVPEALAESAGVVATSATGSTELRAMYGGLQASIGVLALVGLLRERLAGAALFAIACIALGLFSGRLLGLAIDGDPSNYTAGALAFEALIASVSFWLLARGDAS